MVTVGLKEGKKRAAGEFFNSLTSSRKLTHRFAINLTNTCGSIVRDSQSYSCGS